VVAVVVVIPIAVPVSLTVSIPLVAAASVLAFISHWMTLEIVGTGMDRADVVLIMITDPGWKPQNTRESLQALTPPFSPGTLYPCKKIFIDSARHWPVILNIPPFPAFVLIRLAGRRISILLMCTA
jgi:hypothetical protein